MIQVNIRSIKSHIQEINNSLQTLNREVKHKDAISYSSCLSKLYFKVFDYCYLLEKKNLQEKNYVANRQNNSKLGVSSQSYTCLKLATGK